MFVAQPSHWEMANVDWQEFCSAKQVPARPTSVVARIKFVDPAFPGIRGRELKK